MLLMIVTPRWPPSVVALLLLASAALAAPPTLTDVSPRSAERNRPVEIVVRGANLTEKAKLLVPFKASQEVVTPKTPSPAQVKFRLTIDPSVPLGSYPLRVRTDDGISAPTPFVVDVFPAVVEIEDNNAFGRAQKVTPPIVIDGQCAGGDVDFYRFPARKGQRLILEVESARLGSAVLPMLRLTDDRQRLLASDDRQALRGDARVVFVAPADGEYVVELADTRYRGGAPPFYRLKIADYDVIDEVFPLGGKRGTTTAFTLRGSTLPTEYRAARSLRDTFVRGQMPLTLEGMLRPGMPVAPLAVGDLPERLWLKNTGRDPRALDLLPPVTINSRLEMPGDVDRFQFPVEPGQRFRITVQAEPFGSRLDGVLRATDQTGRQLALADDTNLPPLAPGLQGALSADPSIDLTVPPGATLVVIELRDQRNRGGMNFVYRLTVQPALADFTLQATVAELNVPRGGTALLPLAVTRRGYTGPIQLSLRGLPAGWIASGGHVLANDVSAALTLTAPAGSAVSLESAAVTIAGRALEPGLTLQRTAIFTLILNRETGTSSSVLPLNELALGVTAAEAFTITGAASAEAVLGYPTLVTIRLNRAKDALNLPIQLAARDPQTAAGQPLPPERLTIPAPAAVTGDAAMLTVTPGVGLSSGTLDLIVEGKARIANVDRTATAPIVPVTVRRPFEIVPPAPMLALTPGATAMLKLTLQKQPVFKEPVQLRLEGLPAGVSLAKPLQPLTATSNEVLIELKADPKAAATTANATLYCTATIGGRAYAHPAVIVPLQVKK